MSRLLSNLFHGPWILGHFPRRYRYHLVELAGQWDDLRLIRELDAGDALFYLELQAQAAELLPTLNQIRGLAVVVGQDAVTSSAAEQLQSWVREEHSELVLWMNPACADQLDLERRLRQAQREAQRIWATKRPHYLETLL